MQDSPASTRLHAACEEALERAAAAWSAAMSSVRAELAKLQALLADYSTESTPQAELCILLTTGRASAALQQFLASHLGAVLRPLALVEQAFGRQQCVKVFLYQKIPGCE